MNWWCTFDRNYWLELEEQNKHRMIRTFQYRIYVVGKTRTLGIGMDVLGGLELILTRIPSMFIFLGTLHVV